MAIAFGASSDKPASAAFLRFMLCTAVVSSETGVAIGFPLGDGGVVTVGIPIDVAVLCVAISAFDTDATCAQRAVTEIGLGPASVRNIVTCFVGAAVPERLE